MLRTLRQLTAVASTATALLLVAGSAARAAALKARSTEGDLILVHAPDQESYVTRGDGGHRVALPLDTRSIVHSFGAVGRQWYAAAVEFGDEGRRLVVLKGSDTKAKELPAPPVSEPAELHEPSLLIGAGGLEAMAWIEGRAARRQVVKIASWTAAGWREPVTVSPIGPGSQMALATAVLADGSCLLAWAAYDGEDDEILWSRWTDADGPSPPARLAADNAVPDITPALRPTPDGGAFVAWSRFDGSDYRVNLARFDGAAWSKPEVVGPKGSVYPAFHDGPNGAILIYQHAVPRGWKVAELDGKGRILREAGIETAESEPPLVGFVTSQDVSLEWIDRSGTLSMTPGLVWRPVQ